MESLSKKERIKRIVLDMQSALAHLIARNKTIRTELKNIEREAEEIAKKHQAHDVRKHILDL